MLAARADLHCHLDGSLRLETLSELTEQLGLDVDLSQFGLVHSNLQRYLDKFRLTLAVMQTESALTRITAELVEDAVRDNVSCLEIRFSPYAHMKHGLSMRQIVEAVSRGLNSTTNIILCAMREDSVADNMQVAKAVVEYQSLGVVGIDLAGAESRVRASEFRGCFEYVSRHKMGVTIHAGEVGDVSNIEDAIRCGANRIGHGTCLMDNPSLLDEVIARQIPIEVCLSSNWQTGAVSEIRRHPARHMLEAGVCVTLNTDNRLMSATTVSHEIELARTELGFSEAQIERVLRNSLANRF